MKAFNTFLAVAAGAFVLAQFNGCPSGARDEIGNLIRKMPFVRAEIDPYEIDVGTVPVPAGWAVRGQAASYVIAVQPDTGQETMLDAIAWESSTLGGEELEERASIFSSAESFAAFVEREFVPNTLGGNPEIKWAGLSASDVRRVEQDGWHGWTCAVNGARKWTLTEGEIPLRHRFIFLAKGDRLLVGSGVARSSRFGKRDSAFKDCLAALELN